MMFWTLAYSIQRWNKDNQCFHKLAKYYEKYLKSRKSGRKSFKLDIIDLLKWNQQWKLCSQVAKLFTDSLKYQFRGYCIQITKLLNLLYDYSLVV